MNRAEFKELSAMEKIRALTGIFPSDPQVMQDRLAMVNLITRVEAGDADLEFLNEVIDKRFKE